MIQTFTGPSRLTPAQRDWCAADIRALPPAERRSGGAFGLDTLVARLTPPSKLTLVVPAEYHFNASLLGLGAKHVRHIEGGYRRRNEALVDGADVLYAYVKSPDFYRSGEWMTVNIAKRAGVRVELRVIPS